MSNIIYESSQNEMQNSAQNGSQVELQNTLHDELKDSQQKNPQKSAHKFSKNLVQNLSQYDFSRIAVVGCPGSGKTTFSNNLSKILNRTVLHLDKLLWNPNWQMLPYDERKPIHDKLIAEENWIIDGMWRSHLADRYRRATLVVFLDYRRATCVRRAILRRIKYSGKQREDIAQGCLEKLDGYFLKYIWNFKKNVRPLILQLAESHSQSVYTITLTNPKAAKKFLKALENYLV